MIRKSLDVADRCWSESSGEKSSSSGQSSSGEGKCRWSTLKIYSFSGDSVEVKVSYSISGSSLEWFFCGIKSECSSTPRLSCSSCGVSSCGCNTTRGHVPCSIGCNSCGFAHNFSWLFLCCILPIRSGRSINLEGGDWPCCGGSESRSFNKSCVFNSQNNFGSSSTLGIVGNCCASCAGNWCLVVVACCSSSWVRAVIASSLLGWCT